MSVVGKRQSTIGPGHDGGPKPGFLAEPGEPALGIHHDASTARVGDDMSAHPSIARRAGAKRLAPVSLHNSATEQQQKMTGMGHPIAGAPDASSVNPFDPTVPGKRLTPPRAAWGQGGPGDWLENQGHRVVDEAISRSNDSQHPANLGRK
jgi:hypothetical protein